MTHKEMNFIQYLNEAIPNPDFDLKGEYDKWNKILFNNELPIVSLKWGRYHSSHGRATARYFPATGEVVNLQISISKAFNLNDENYRKYLIHEMIHIYLYINKIFKNHDGGGHGYHFQNKLKEINSKLDFVVPMREDDVYEKLFSNDGKPCLLVTWEKDDRKCYQIYIYKLKDHVLDKAKTANEERNVEVYEINSNDARKESIPIKQKIKTYSITGSGYYNTHEKIEKLIQNSKKLTQ